MDTVLIQEYVELAQLIKHNTSKYDDMTDEKGFYEAYFRLSEKWSKQPN